MHQHIEPRAEPVDQVRGDGFPMLLERRIRHADVRDRQMKPVHMTRADLIAHIRYFKRGQLVVLDQSDHGRSGRQRISSGGF